MIKKTFTLYPVSFIDDNGSQNDGLWSHNPSNPRGEYLIGEPIQVEVEFGEMGPHARDAKIAGLREQLEKLEAES